MAESVPTYKFILLGDLGVGKTTFFLQLKHGRFIDSDTDQFTGSDHLEYTQVVDGTKVKVSLFDTGGLEQFRTLTPNFYRESLAILLFYSVEALYTFEHLYQWAEDAECCVQNDASQLTWALIGNKCDLMQEINDETIQSFCRDRLKTELSYVVSAKSGENVKNAFEAIVAAAHRKHLEQGFHEAAPQPPLKVNLTTKAKPCAC